MDVVHDLIAQIFARQAKSGEAGIINLGKITFGLQQELTHQLLESGSKVNLYGLSGLFYEQDGLEVSQESSVEVAVQTRGFEIIVDLLNTQDDDYLFYANFYYEDDGELYKVEVDSM